MVKSIQIILLLSFTTFHLCAQSEWPLQHVDKKAGLSNSAINSVYMDSHDFAWFGTWDGLNRYDGDEVITYKPIANDPHSLSNNIVRQILEDKNDHLWVITHNGINRYDSKLDIFHRYLDNIDPFPFLENNLKATLSDDSTIYISLIGWGIGRFSSDLNAFVPIQINDHPFENIHDIGAHNGYLYMLDQESNLLAINENKNLSKYSLDWTFKNTFHQFIHFGSHYFFIYQKDSEKLVFQELEHGKPTKTRIVDLNGAHVTAITPSMDPSTLFIGTDEGVLFRAKLSGSSVKLVSMSTQLSTLHKKKLKIFSIHESSQHILWVGTDGDGVYKYLTKEQSFHFLGDGAASEGKLSNSIVRSVLMDKKGNLYVGTRSGGLNILSHSKKQTTIINKKNGLSDNTVLAISNDNKGNIWMGLDGEGLDMLEQKTGKVYHFPRDFSNPKKIPYFSSVYEIHFDAYGHLWLGTSGYGVIYLDIETDQEGKYILKESYPIQPGFKDKSGIRIRSNIVYSIVEEEPNILWFGMRNGGLYRYNTLTRQFTHNLDEEHGSRSALSNNDVLSLYIDHKNSLWVGTSGGLNQVNLRDFTVTQYAKNDGLANNTVHGILQDTKGRLWLSSNNGLFAFSPETNTFKNYDWSDGLLNYEYTDGAFFQAEKDDRLFFGGTKGLDIVIPSQIDTSETFPRLAFRDLFISYANIKPTDSTHILQTTIDLQDQITLNHHQNFMQLRFTTLDYWHKQRCSYRYFLEGFDEDWINIGKQSSINLSNIPPGNYTLHLNNTNENGDWNPEERKLAIVITPPFWATHLAFSIYAMLFLLSQIGLVLILRNRAKKKKHLEIERLEKEQGDAIQKYKLEFFTDMAHEFRTPLTLILGPAFSLLEKTKSNPTLNGPIKSIYRNSLRLQKLIQELIQFRKVELGKQKIYIRSVNVVKFTEEILESFRQYAMSKEIILTYETQEDSLLSHVDTTILEKVLINLISNALKYTEHKGKVEIKVWQKSNRTYFCVRDTGIGIYSNELSKIFDRFTDVPINKDKYASNSVGIGLSLTSKLISLHKGEITVESKPGQGSIFTFWLPSLSGDYEGTYGNQEDDNVLTELEDHVNTELYQPNHLDPEIINISLERFDHHVLVVDDNIQILSLLKELLLNKYNVVTCTSGSEALTLLANQRIDLVISDVIMPEMDGFTLCNTIKTTTEISHIPVILLTAKGEIEERIEGLQAGADAYIPKPFHPNHLYVRIDKLISSRENLKKKFDSFANSGNEFSSFGIGARDDEFIKSLDQYIKTEMGNPELDAIHLAGHLNLSKTSLYKKIKALTGETPHALINQYRLKQAAWLLANSDNNVSEIINITGFNSRSYFYKSFQEMFHCAPSSYPS